MVEVEPESPLREDCLSMVNPLATAEYPIAAVSKLTGVSCHALRVWERRYGFPIPHRTAAGHRRYHHEQVVILRQIFDLSKQGRPIGDLISAFVAGQLPIDTGTPNAEQGTSRNLTLPDLISLLQVGDYVTVDALLDESERRVGTRDMATQLIAPALTETGERWFRNQCSVYQEHCISGYLRRRLGTAIAVMRRANTQPGYTLILGTVQGDRHEGGVLIANVLLESLGCRVINLGVDLPIAEYVKAVDELQPDALGLSFVLSRNINKRFEELSRLTKVPVFVGGRSILNYQKLARHYGLIPVAGPAEAAVSAILREFEAQAKRERTSRGTLRKPPTTDAPARGG